MRNIIPWHHPEQNSLIHTNFHNALEQMFENFAQHFNHEDFEPWYLSMKEFMPKVDLKETDKEMHVSADLPGMTEHDIDLSLQDNVLTIKGEKKVEDSKKDHNYHYAERSYGSFQRAITLPVTAEPDKIEATFKNGVLEVVIPKKENANTGKHITITK